MENRYISATSRPFANSKARRAEKDVPEWKAAPKRSTGKKDANNTIRARDSSPRQKQLPEPRRRSGRLRSPSLPAISEASHYDNNDGPKTACPSIAIATTPRTTPITTSTTNGLAEAQGLRASNEALLELVTELIRMIPSSFPVHEMIRRREEARALADKAPSAAADVEQQLFDLAATTTPSLPLLEGNAVKTARKPNFAKGHQPRSKSSVF